MPCRAMALVWCQVAALCWIILRCIVAWLVTPDDRTAWYIGSSLSIAARRDSTPLKRSLSESGLADSEIARTGRDSDPHPQDPGRGGRKSSARVHAERPACMQPARRQIIRDVGFSEAFPAEFLKIVDGDV